MQTRNLDVAVRELRSQQDRLIQIKEHDMERYACGQPTVFSLQSPALRCLLEGRDTANRMCIVNTWLACSSEAFIDAHIGLICTPWSANPVLAGPPQAGCILAGQCVVTSL